MTTQNKASPMPLIDLGRVSRETRGPNGGQGDMISGRKNGLSND
jgi:hypothetical protein